jgi:catechol 2,3-dioxygenase-like lactoylglutathione lyase family enzyme
MEASMSFIHHLGVFASDFAASERFYTAALRPLGINAGYRADGVAEYWQPEQDTPSLSLERAKNETAVTRGMHIAFMAGNRQEVDAFHAAAVAAGHPGTLHAHGTNTAPTVRSSAIPTATTSKPFTRRSPSGPVLSLRRLTPHTVSCRRSGSRGSRSRRGVRW